ncbi:acyl carrier protein [Paenibacillus pabuli]|uniref:acyl carrier protein n=1 Tax=Paenibacillus pabuli TaxID=1472 RepID=UPI003CF35FE0
MDEIILKQLFADTLELELDKISDSLEYNTIPQWDSISHMALISSIEDEFDIMLSTDDVLNMSSFGIAKEILEKHGVKFI